jgi:hypothetical protein
VPRGAWQSSVYVKVRDRAAYAFALTSAAVALRLDDGGDGDGDRVADVRIVLGGLATKPWRCHDAEALLHGRLLTLDTATVAASACLTGARADDAREFTVELGRRTVVRALLEAGRRVRRPLTPARHSPVARDPGAVRTASGRAGGRLEVRGQHGRPDRPPSAVRCAATWSGEDRSCPPSPDGCA